MIFLVKITTTFLPTMNLEVISYEDFSILMFESASIEAAQEALATLPFAQLHLIDFDLIPLAPFTGLTRLFQAPTEAPVGKTQ